MNQMKKIVTALMEQGKGILAADESNPTANERFSALGIEPTEENRRRYRELLLTTPGIEKYLSGVILYDETIRQKTTQGVSFPEWLQSQNILVGIKVDEGLEEIPEVQNGKVTKGLDGLGKRVKEYTEMGAVFAKWRAVAVVGDGYADPAIKENAKRLAEYASVCQEHSVVPMVEPEVLMDGTHSAEDAEGAIIETVAIVCDQLQQSGVALEAVILKTAMSVSGKEAVGRADADEVAERTVRALKTAVPDTMGGVVFLSGGQSPEEAVKNLNAIARLEPHPWPITFSFSRALQSPVLAEWKGKDENADEAQALFLRRVALAIAADSGAYSESMEAFG
ncbi:fructose-bisphosphate aldolase class I [Candidatus Kaiserbacteria bacterium CG10_big_fil_rev_8_21_14_0_10_45_20]|uniref:fructose-bisphosphate aldolase n=1 Tax=Candidatus Kaiserbacteria bacterium CG10_big_fil_rev_8_21_14_0_10_45_20 TaxID=1974607 RepID=A0A2H0UF46_9BACT|nr:MAG: fructose-bisphosphate aldolase class I [Candidatus Kaiserbacteria bacterium CG10_big_fil_rev_8_21_14_0_10_45_20]